MSKKVAAILWGHGKLNHPGLHVGQRNDNNCHLYSTEHKLLLKKGFYSGRVCECLTL